jgi:glutathione S-transferase
MFFWHGSGAPYQGQMNHFNKFAKEKLPCTFHRPLLSFPNLADPI